VAPLEALTWGSLFIEQRARFSMLHESSLSNWIGLLPKADMFGYVTAKAALLYCGCWSRIPTDPQLLHPCWRGVSVPSKTAHRKHCPWMCVACFWGAPVIGVASGLDPSTILRTICCDFLLYCCMIYVQACYSTTTWVS